MSHDPITFDRDLSFHVLTAQIGTVFLDEEYLSAPTTGMPAITTDPARAVRFQTQQAAREAALTVPYYLWRVRRVQIISTDLGTVQGTADVDPAAMQSGGGGPGGGNGNQP
jgi:hypothetical protein